MKDEHLKAALLLFLLDYYGEISGRTRIQKMMYLTNLIGWNAVKDYHFYQYGPYSSWLKRALDLYVKRNLIEEKQEQLDDEKTLYKYKITETGSNLVKRLDVSSLEFTEKTKSFLDVLKKYRNDELEIMSSLYFVRKSDPEIDTDDRLVKVIHLHKPWYSQDKIKENLTVFPLMEKFA